MKQLLLGSGNWHWEGWTTLDANHGSGADFIAAIPPLPDEVKCETYSHILASHFIEHIFRWEALSLLKECYEILELGGILTLEQPNLEYCAKIVAGMIDPPPGSNREQFGYWGIYGEPNGNPLYGHRAGYTPSTLSDLVVEAGFDRENILILPGRYHIPIRDFTLQVTK